MTSGDEEVGQRAVAAPAETRPRKSGGRARHLRGRLRISWEIDGAAPPAGPDARGLCYRAVVAEALYQPFPIPGTARGHVWHHVPATRRPRHFHAEPELNLIAAGRAAFGYGEATVSVSAGDLLWWPPGQDHVLLDATPDLDLYVIGVTPAFSERVLAGRAPVTSGGAARLRLDHSTLASLQTACAVQLAAGDAAAVEHHLGNLWREAQALRAGSRDHHPLTVRALTSLLGRPDLKRGELARLIRGNASEVSRYFHRDIGLTLVAYRTRLRLLRFIQLVEGGGHSFLAAAIEAGFGSYSQCHRAFQQAFDCPPRVFFGTGVSEEMKGRFAPF
jgi:AraC-like DNA-binding protein/mannose-6-phosphate isomerase-like protein (cupin superfamily)